MSERKREDVVKKKLCGQCQQIDMLTLASVNNIIEVYEHNFKPDSALR